MNHSETAKDDLYTKEDLREMVMVRMPAPKLVHAVMKTELEGDRANRYLARAMLALAMIFTGVCVFCLSVGWWSEAVMTAVLAGVLYQQQYVTRWGNRGSQNRYHSNHAILCTLRARQDEEDGIRRHLERYGPVADAPPEHAEEYTRLVLQEGACIRYRQYLQERMAELRGEQNPNGKPEAVE